MTTKLDYAQLCQELEVDVLDTWREHTLLRLPIHDDSTQAALRLGPSVVDGFEATYVLKTVCPNSGQITAVRVPPSVASAKEAATWVNGGIDPEQPTFGRAVKTSKPYVPVNTRIVYDAALWDVHCIIDEDE
jgi:hypothetical protein